MKSQYKIAKATNQQRNLIIPLLVAEGLPVKDLPESLDNFLVSLEGNAVTGVIGLERYENYGLLRSLVIDKKHRNKNIATALVKELESMAVSLGIDSIYLLTETAPRYFEGKGYQKIERSEVPKPVQGSSEFSSVCPVSAIVMKKSIQ